MRLLECPRCKASFENIEPGQTKITCHFCRFTTDIRDVTEGGSDALLRRGMLLVEYADFLAAIEVFDEALKLAPENAHIYVGRLLAEVQLEKESWLGNHNIDLNQYPSYQKALRFADSELKQRLELYNVQVQERLAEIAKRHEKDKARAEEERRRREENDAKLEAEEAERMKKLVAEYEEMRKRTRPKRIIRNVIILLIIIAIAGFFWSRNNERNAQAQRFVDLDFLVELMNERPTSNEISRNYNIRLTRNDTGTRPHLMIFSGQPPRNVDYRRLNFNFVNSQLDFLRIYDPVYFAGIDISNFNNDTAADFVDIFSAIDGVIIDDVYEWAFGRMRVTFFYEDIRVRISVSMRDDVSVTITRADETYLDD